MATKTTRRVLILDRAGSDKHKLNRHNLKILGALTPANFKNAVMSAYGDASATGKANILYSGTVSPSGQIRLTAKLYQAKRNMVSPKRYKMFATFHVPDGERLRARAGLRKDWFEKSLKSYPSKPPVPEGFKTRLKRMVKVG